MRVLLAGGGTAGHINPALAIAKTVLKHEKKSEILFIGTQKGMEATLIPKEGFAIKFIKAEGIKTHLTLKNIKPICEFLLSIQTSKRIIKKFKPDVVIGTGGYVCAPVVYAANMMKIPTLIHEQNVFPGSAIKMLAKKSTVTAVSFADSVNYLKEAREIIVTGNPIRPTLLNANREKSRAELKIDGKKLILVFGGSLGSEKINRVMVDYIGKIGHRDDIHLIFGTGKIWHPDVFEWLDEKGIKIPKNVEIKEYIHNMDTMLSAADLVISRAGAITVSELCVLGKPSILIPSLNVTHNHQEYNARALADKNAASIIMENDFDADILHREIDRLILDNKLLHDMGQNALNMGKTKAAETIYNRIKKM